MKTNQDYKNSALNALRGNWTPAVVLAIVYALISLIASGSSLSNLMDAPASYIVSGGLGLLSLFVVAPFSAGVAAAFLSLIRTGSSDLTGTAFRETLSRYLHKVGTLFLMAIYIVLWSLLMFIPGIIKAYAYSMTPYILKDNPELGWDETIHLSRMMMKGRKFDLFYLQISFIGWFLLCLLTAGIGFFWFIPYYQAAEASFYEDVKADYLAKS